MNSEHARQAFEELKKLGAYVHPVPDEAHIAFTMGWIDKNENPLADINGRRVKEVFELGRFINPYGYRQDVHEILRKHRLVTDWHDFGLVVVYEDPEAVGMQHGYRLYFANHDEQNHQVNVRLHCTELADILDGLMSTEEAHAGAMWDGSSPEHKLQRPLPPTEIINRWIKATFEHVKTHGMDRSSAKDRHFSVTWT
jgi:hypothetical protein